MIDRRLLDFRERCFLQQQKDEAVFALLEEEGCVIKIGGNPGNVLFLLCSGAQDLLAGNKCGTYVIP